MILMVFRTPFDAISMIVHTFFLKEAYSSIEQNNSVRLTLTCVIFGIVSCILFLYNGIVWKTFGPMYVRLSGKLRKEFIGRIIDLQDWEEEMQLAEYKMDAIDSISKRFEGSKEALKMQEMSEDERAWLLVKMVCVEDISAQHTLSGAIWL